MGASTVSAQLRQIEAEKILDIKDFGNVYTDNSLSNEDCRQKAAKIFYLSFERKFDFSYFESDCGEPARQRELSENPFREVL
jgi:thymidylate synthase ThyX